MPEPNLEPGTTLQHRLDVIDEWRLQNWQEARCEPDVVLPVQFNDLIRRRRHCDGETRLALAVLEDAIRIYIKCGSSRRGRSGKKLFLEVSDWFQSRAHGPFSFEYICELLDVHSESLRRRLNDLTIDDFPTKQTHSVGRRHIMRARSSSRKRSILKRPEVFRPVSIADHSQNPTAFATAAPVLAE